MPSAKVRQAVFLNVEVLFDILKIEHTNFYQLNSISNTIKCFFGDEIMQFKHYNCL